MRYILILLLLITFDAYAGRCDSQAECREQTTESIRQAQEQRDQETKDRNTEIRR